MIKLFIGNHKEGKRNAKEFYRKLKKVTNNNDDELANQVVTASLQCTANGLFVEARELTKLCYKQIVNEKLLKEAARVSSAM